MINGRNYFDQLVKNDLRTYDNIQKVTIGQGDYYTTGRLLDYPYFEKCYKLIELSKQWELRADPKAIQQTNCTRKLKRKYNNVFHYWKSKKKKNILDFLQRTVCYILFWYNINVKWINITL